MFFSLDEMSSPPVPSRPVEVEGVPSHPLHDIPANHPEELPLSSSNESVPSQNEVYVPENMDNYDDHAFAPDVAAERTDDFDLTDSMEILDVSETVPSGETPTADADDFSSSVVASPVVSPSSAASATVTIPQLDIREFITEQIRLYHLKRDHALRLLEWNEKMMRYFAAQRIPFIQKIIYAKQRITLSNVAMLEMKSLLEYIYEMHLFTHKHSKNVKLFGSFLEENGGFPRPPPGSVTDPAVLSMGALAALVHSSNQTHGVFAARIKDAIGEIQLLFKQYNKQRDVMVSAMEASCDDCDAKCKKAYAVLDEIVLAVANSRRLLAGEKPLKTIPVETASSVASTPSSTQSPDKIVAMYEELFRDINLEECVAFSKSYPSTATAIPATTLVAPLTTRSRKDIFSLEQQYREGVLAVARAHRSLFSQCAVSLNAINTAEETRSVTMHRILMQTTVAQVQMHSAIAKMAEKCYNDVTGAPSVALTNRTPEEECYIQPIGGSAAPGQSVFRDDLAAGRDSRNREVATAQSQALHLSPGSAAAVGPIGSGLNDDLFDVNLLCGMDAFSQHVIGSMEHLSSVPPCPPAPGPLPINENISLSARVIYSRGIFGTKVESLLVLTSDNNLICVPLNVLNQDPRMLEWAENARAAPGDCECSEDPAVVNMITLKAKGISKAIAFEMDAFYTQAKIVETKNGPKPNTVELKMKAGIFDRGDAVVKFLTPEHASIWVKRINDINVHNQPKK